jgi:AcrR family transcriptional regulator
MNSILFIVNKDIDTGWLRQNMNTEDKAENGLEGNEPRPDYAMSLEHLSARENGADKRTRTRARLKLATFRIMRKDGIGDLKVTQVTHAAGVAAGTFYTHFENLDDLVREVVGEFFNMEANPALPLAPGADPFDAMKNGFLGIVALFRQNIMIFRSLVELRGKEPLFRKIWTEFDNRWARQFAAIVTAQPGREGTDPRLAIMLGHAALAMVDEVLMRIFFDRYEDLVAFGDDDETIAELLTVLRYRLLFAADPPAEKISLVESLIDPGDLLA